MSNPFAQARDRMVREQLKARGITDPRVLEVMRTLPREQFLTPAQASSPAEAYRDAAQPVGHGQTLSQPYMVAYMTQALELSDEDRVLEIGTGTGYQTAVLAGIAREVWTVERNPALADEARDRLHRCGVQNVHFHVGDGTLGWDAGAPYQAILVTAGAPEIPNALRDQLAPGGRLVLPVGSLSHQELVRIVRDPEGRDARPEILLECRFVPLVGEGGWEPESRTPPSVHPDE